ncbi:MAG: undecaprenyldiphospho-muramoylpentapeptide beta-N-acetylglucosaminyltransferase [Pseudomonadota bacterium]|nr:undecaprenyldiphospho-muramoylpentapeptide beta-N-acetylglucosaminyltransferase [Pseudomonadota bacterium]
MSAPFLLMAGGTGGHVFPALAVAAELQARGRQVHWLGSRHGMENRLVPAAGYPFSPIRVRGLRGRGRLSLLAAPGRLSVALAEALAVVGRVRPAAVLGMGGFAAGPGAVAARLLGRPLVVHEQNAVAGMTNRWCARLADRVLAAFPGAFGSEITCTIVGNPVRREIAALAPPEVRFAERSGSLRLLVLGGSQGAAALNERVPAALARLRAAGAPDVVVRHQAGGGQLEPARAAYRQAQLPFEPEPFIEDMAAAYGWADLVICRSGALTVAELAAAGVGALMVPFPHAVDDHQTRNAAYLAEAGAGRILPQAELDAERLAAELAPLLADRAALTAMAVAARRQAHPQATAAVADALLAMEAGR